MPSRLTPASPSAIRFVVPYTPGGNASIGAEHVAKSPPDGHTILLIAAAHVVLPHLTSTPYDAIKEFSAIASLDASDQIMVVSPSLPVSKLREFVALAKSKPGQLNFASAGVGSSNHLATELFNMVAGTQIRHIPYKGSVQAVTGVRTGQVQMTLNTPLPVVPLAKAGKLKAIAMSGEKRLAALPQVPTFAEAGLPGFEAKNWHGVIGPAGIPRGIVNKLSAELGRIMTSADVVDKIVVQGIEAFVTNADQFATLIRADSAKWAKVIKAAGIKVE